MVTNTTLLSKMALSVRTNDSKIPSQQINEPKETRSVDKTNKILYTLGGLAAAGLAAVLIYNNVKTGKSKSQNTLSNLLNLAELESKIKVLSQDERPIFFSQYDKFRNQSYDFVSYLKSQTNSLIPLNKLFSAKNANIKTLPNIPDIIKISGTNNSVAEDITKILSTHYKGDYQKVKYTQGYTKEFIEVLEEMSGVSQKSNKHTFVYFENIETFIKEIGQPEHKELQKRFSALIKANSQNNLTYIVDKDINEANYKFGQLNFDFSESINKIDLTQDLEAFSKAEHNAYLQRMSQIGEDIEIYVEKLHGIALSDKTKQQNIIFFENDTGSLTERLMEMVTRRNNDKFDKIVCDYSMMPSELIKILEEKVKEAQVLFDMTNKRTYLELHGAENVLKRFTPGTEEFEKFLKLTENCSQKNLTILLSSKTKNISNHLFEKNENIKNITFDIEQILGNLVEVPLRKTIENMEKENFSFIDKDYLINPYVVHVLREKAGLINAQNVENGIMLYGDEEKVNITAQAIKNSLDLNFKEVKFDPDHAFDSIKKIVRTAEEAEVEYQRTGKRTMIDAVEWDKLLVDEDNHESLLMIARFKSFVENVSENYHATILLKTSKPLDAFEEASIGSQRFEMKMKMK